MKTKQKVDTIINSFLSIIGILIIVLAILKYSDLKLVFISTLMSYALLNLAQFILTKESKDFEGLYTAMASFAVGLVDIFLNFNIVNVISVSLLAWVGLMSIIKFIKTDYYNDRRDRMYKLRIISLIVFIIVGIITSLALNYSSNVQLLVIGYFFLIHGILELIDPITKYLIGK